MSLKVTFLKILPPNSLSQWILRIEENENHLQEFLGQSWGEKSLSKLKLKPEDLKTNSLTHYLCFFLFISYKTLIFLKKYDFSIRTNVEVLTKLKRNSYRLWDNRHRGKKALLEKVTNWSLFNFFVIFFTIFYLNFAGHPEWLSEWVSDWLTDWLRE